MTVSRSSSRLEENRQDGLGRRGFLAVLLAGWLGSASLADLEARKNYFKHTLKNGNTAEQNIRRFGYTNYVAVGENIAAGFEPANDAMKAWKSSPEHDRNMRSDRFTEIGIGRAYKKGSKYGWYWTTTFGDR